MRGEREEAGCEDDDDHHGGPDVRPHGNGAFVAPGVEGVAYKGGSVVGGGRWDEFSGEFGEAGLARRWFFEFTFTSDQDVFT